MQRRVEALGRECRACRESRVVVVVGGLGEMSRRALRLWEGGGGKRTAKARPCGWKQQLSW